MWNVWNWMCVALSKFNHWLLVCILWKSMWKWPNMLAEIMCMCARIFAIDLRDCLQFNCLCHTHTHTHHAHPKCRIRKFSNRKKNRFKTNCDNNKNNNKKNSSWILNAANTLFSIHHQNKYRNYISIFTIAVADCMCKYK